MNRFLVHSVEVAGPATHAIVIGVGAYPHLVGGTGEISDKNEGMRQLSSPPASARVVAEWLIDKLNDPAKPLATVALMLSERDPHPFRNPKTTDDHAVEPATMSNMKQALNEWKTRGGKGTDRLLLYFCGHGIARGTDVSLLLADFGANPNNPLEAAIDFGNCWLGLEVCAAREQCFFIDACRANSETTLGANGYMGDPIFMPDAYSLPMPAPPPREAPIYYSTLAGQDAYGQENRPSPFTDALLQALNGAGSDDSEGDWRVSTTRLKEAMDYFMKRAVDSGHRRLQVPATNHLTTFYLHHMDGEPMVPVFVACEPEEANTLAEFSCLSGGVVRAQRAPQPGMWEVPLPAGSYEFVVEFPAGEYGRASRERYVGPVFKRIPLKVQL